MSALERITALLHTARVAGGWIDEDVARQVLAELGMDEAGHLIAPAPASDEDRQTLGTLEPPPALEA